MSGLEPGRPRRPRWVAVVAVVLAVALAGSGAAALVSSLVGGGAGGREDYCAALRSSNDELAALVGRSGSGATGSFGESLGVLEGLAAASPSEIRAEWNSLILALRGLRDALAAADIDLGGEDVDLRGLSDATPEEQAAVSAAATQLQSPAVRSATATIEDHAQQTCGVILGATDDAPAP